MEHVDGRVVLEGTASVGLKPGEMTTMAGQRRVSATPTACPLRGHGRAGAQNDRLGEAVVLSAGTPTPAQ